MSLQDNFQNTYRHLSLSFGVWKSVPELEHQTYRAVRNLNFNLKAADENRLFHLNEMNEFRLEAYENTKLYKERSKKWCDIHI